MKTKENQVQVLSDENIINRIYYIRGKKVMIDMDLATLYGVETRVMNQAVKRNEKRFPEDFMFQLTKEEWESLLLEFATSNLKSQFVISSSHGGRRKLPFVFTEQGVAMLSSVLNSDNAIMVNIQIIRVFTKMRELLNTHEEILRKLETIEKKDLEQDEQIMLIFEYLKQLEQTKQETLEQKKRHQIGYKQKQ